MKGLVKNICVIFLSIILSSCTNNTKPNSDVEGNLSTDSYLRAVWINYNELSMKAEKTNTEESFTNKIEDMFDKVSKFGLNTVIVQVRPFSDALYKSDIFPWSEYISNEQGKDPGYDPLQIMIEKARKYNLKIHAWINPYRVSYNTDYTKLSKDNPARVWHDDNDITNDTYLFTTKDGIYYNPAILEVQKLIIDGIREIAENYDVDGIHMDDYFYPDMYDDFDIKEYNEYVSNGGIKSIEDWRRENVNALIKGIYSAIKSINKDMIFGISPGGNIEINFNKNYADIKIWVSEKGYIDYIMPQLYYGFENKNKPFEKTYDEWERAITNKDVLLYIGLPAYKAGKEDVNAGEYSENMDTGRYEFLNKSDVIKRQIEYIRKRENKGFAIYSYSSLFGENISEKQKKEIENIKSVL